MFKLPERVLSEEYDNGYGVTVIINGYGSEDEPYELASRPILDYQ